MLQQIFLVALIISFSILAAILLKKAPQLSDIGKVTPVRKKKKFLYRLWKKVAGIPLIRDFSWNRILQKLLSKTRILILKIEGKIGDHLHFLRKKSEEKKK